MREVTKEEAVIELARATIFYPSYTVIGVLNPTRIESGTFRSAFIDKIGEVPRWLAPNFTRINMSRIETDCVKILFKSNPLHFKGVSLNQFYISKDHTEKNFDTAMEYIYPCLVGSNFNFTVF